VVADSTTKFTPNSVNNSSLFSANKKNCSGGVDDGVGVGVGVELAAGVVLGVGVIELVGVTDGVADGRTLDADGVTVGVIDGVTDGVGVDVVVGVGVGDTN